jgi:hypothetical protein
VSEARYWSIDHCGWVAAPTATDPLATPWSAHGLPRPADLPAALDGYDVVGLPRPAAEVPGQRPALLRPVHQPGHLGTRGTTAQ